MGYDDSNEKIDRFARGIIRRKIKQLIGRAGFTQQDHADLEQDLLLRVLQSLPSYDPAQAHRNVFVTTVVERYVANILRNKQAEKRDHQRISSLHIHVRTDDDEQVEMIHTIGQREQDARRGRHPRSNEDLAQLGRDLAEVIAALPDQLRNLAERLKTMNVSEAARDMGIPRTTIDAWVRKLRQRFEKAGLRDYI